MCLQTPLQRLKAKLRHHLRCMQHHRIWWTWMTCTQLLRLHRHRLFSCPRLTLRQAKTYRHLCMGPTCLKCQPQRCSPLPALSCICQHSLRQRPLLFRVDLHPWRLEATLLLSSKLVVRTPLLICLVNSSSRHSYVCCSTGDLYSEIPLALLPGRQPGRQGSVLCQLAYPL